MGRQTILQKITDYILTGGRRTTAVNTRDVLNEMANTYMSVIHDTADNFTASNPILETKQMGVVSDSLLSSPQYKIGDGINHWNDLPYSSGGGGIPNLQQVTDTGSTFDNDIDLIGAVDDFYKVRIGTDGSDNGSVQIYDNNNNSIIESLGDRGFKVFNNANSVALFEVIRDDGVDTDKVVINATTTELTQGTPSKLLRLNASNEIVSSSLDETSIKFKSGTTGTGSITTILGSNDATGNYSLSIGKDTTAYNYGEFVRGSNPLSIKAQSGTVHFTKKTTNATLTETFLDGSSSRFVINVNASYKVKLYAIAVDEGTGDAKEWEGKGIIKNLAGTTSLVGTLTMTSTNGDTSLSSTSITVTADDTNDSLKVAVTGVAATNISWNIRCEYVRVGYTSNAPIPIGLIFSNDFTSGAWTAIDGVGTYTFNASDITMSGNSSVAPIQGYGLKSNRYTSCENSVFYIDVEVSATSRVGAGFYATLQGTYTNLFLDSSIQACVDNTLKATTYPTVLTWTAGDTIRIKYTRSLTAMTLEISNLTNPNTLNITQALSNVYGGSASERIYSGLTQLFMSNWRGTSNKVVAINYSSTDWKYADVLFIGTSKTAGFYCDLKANRFTDLYVAATGKKVNNWATSSGTTATYLLQVTEIIEMQPKAVYIEGPCNDVRNSVLQATIEANMNSLISQLRVGISGVKIYVQLCWPELTAVNFTVLNAYLSTLAAADLVVIPTTGFNTATMLNADNIHINATGNTFIQTLNATYIV